MKDRLKIVINLLHQEYRDIKSMLDFNSPFELLVAVSLSAQTTDVAVNRTTPGLFARWPDAESLAEAEPVELEAVIYSLGFFRQKARNLIGAARLIRQCFGGKVPRAMEDLTSLPGVGRKSANVIRAHIWNLPGIIVDTHFGRVSRRLGLTLEKSPDAVEVDLGARVVPKEQIFFSMAVNKHGRVYCMARRPDCSHCPLSEVCPRVGL